jgi:CrcB protein
VRIERVAAFAVAAGGAIGALARYAVGRIWVVHAGQFPWSTFAINTSGAFAIGFILTLIGRRVIRWPATQPLLVTGFLGAWTTMSTFAVEADLLVRDGRAAIAVVYILGSAVSGLAATLFGVRLARR